MIAITGDTKTVQEAASSDVSVRARRPPPIACLAWAVTLILCDGCPPLLGGESGSFTADEITNAASWTETSRTLESFRDGQLSRALMYPFEQAIQSTLQLLDQHLLQLKGPPPPLRLPAASAADRLRWVGYLALSKASLLGKIAEKRTDMKPQLERVSLAQTTLKATEEALTLLTTLTKGDHPQDSAALREWINKSAITDNLYYLRAHAFALLWESGVGNDNKKSARKNWDMINASYIIAYPAGTPEMDKVLGVMTPNTGSMTPVAWVGVAMLTLALVLSLLVKNLDVFKQWVLRSFIALGAAMTATVIPGVLNIDLDKRIVAGGTLAVIIIIYLFNPPKIEGGNP